MDRHLVRPHDLEIATHPYDGAFAGRIERFTRVGFEVRLGLRVAGEPAPVLVTLTRADATAKGLAEGRDVWIKPVSGASRVKVSGQALAVAAEIPVPADAAAAVAASLH